MLDEIDGGRTLTKYYKVVYLRSIEYTHTNTTGIKKSLCLLRSYVVDGWAQPMYYTYFFLETTTLGNLEISVYNNGVVLKRSTLWLFHLGTMTVPL